MKEYKVESLTFYSKLTLDKNHIAKSSSREITAKLNEYSAEGWRLASTDTTSHGSAIYVYLYFEKDTI